MILRSTLVPRRKGVGTMPATSKKQQRFMGAELARKRAGKKTQTGMSEGQLEEYAKGAVKEKPAKAK